MKRVYPSTNALGTARVDCHNCRELGQRCDRQRPRCGTCLESKRRCSGFAMELKWSTSRAKRQSRHGTATEQEQTDATRPFRFVTTAPKRRKKRRLLEGNAEPFMTVFNVAEQPISSEQAESDNRTPNVEQRDIPPFQDYGEGDSSSTAWYESGYPAGDTVDQEGFFVHVNQQPAPLLTIGEDGDADSNDMDDVDYDYGNDDNNEVSWPSPSSSSSSDGSPFHQFPLSPIVKYGSFANKVAAVLDMYDQEFCILPLSEDVQSNPFRVRRETCESSAHLLHAVLALASQHLAKKNNSAEMLTQMHSHQATAVKLFSQAVAYTPAFTALDTLLLLVNFEATQTASSTWGVHLGGAFNIIESIGIDVVCQRSSRTRAQIAMLVWWDVTIALISRKAPRFPARYLETLLHYSGEDGWSWVSLNGCPADLVMFMARLARLAAIYEKVLDMEWTTFDHTPVRQIIAEIRRWKNPDDVDAALDGFPTPSAPPTHAPERADLGPETESHPPHEEDPDVQLNRMHCIEAWRQAILLYAHRTFFRRRRQQDSANDTSISSEPNATSQQERHLQRHRHRIITLLARQVLDHVRCIPSTAIVQKQTLLPVFLAAAEITAMSGQENRDFARSYCHHWSVTARYDMFATVATLLERVWADADAAAADAFGAGEGDVEGSSEEYWWGCTVGQADFTSPSAASTSAFSDENAAENGLLVSELLLG